MRGLGEVVTAFPAESRLLGAGRTLIALAQASVLAFTPAAYLFVPVGGNEVVLECSRFPQAAGAYCLLGGLERQTVSWLLLVVLLVVASGLLPRYTSVLHLWVSLSVNTAITLPDGGEAIAQVATIFLALACANDRRRWHWQPPRRDATSSVFQGVAWAGMWGLRLQLAYVYLNSAVAKVAVAPWQDGTATYYVARMENFGAAGWFSSLILWATALPVIAVLTSWGAIVAEASMTVLLVGGPRRQLAALVIGCALHASIIVQLGIVSFGLIMIGTVACAASRGSAVAAAEALGWVRSRRAGRSPALAPARSPAAGQESPHPARFPSSPDGSDQSQPA